MTFSPAPRNLVYQIFVDRFAGTDGQPLPPVPQDAQQHRHHAGGNLEGIQARLQHIRDLGADSVYLTPVFEAESNHKYDALSYENVDARFGGNGAFETLAAKCRESGMGLIVDGVFNHIGCRHPWFADAQANPDSPYRNFFKWRDYPREFHCWQGHRGLPELDLQNPAVIDALLSAPDSVLRRWLRRGATGWRLDCANDLGRETCALATHTAREEGAIDGVVGEVMAYAEDWVQDGRLDGVMNYYFRQTVLALISGEIPVSQAAYNFKRMARRFPREALLRSWNMISSHDTPRLATLVPDVARRMFALTLSFCFPGVPLVYYGEETGMQGDRDPDNRRSMVWDESQWDRQILNAVRQLAAIRASHPALRFGDYLPMPQPGAPTILSFARVTDTPQEIILVVANASDEPISCRVFTPYSHLFDSLPLHNLLRQESHIRVSSGSIQVELAPWTVAIYAPDDSTIPEYRFFRNH
ncbi:MAG: glycoside hydrolase family 13 protein [Candidatus Sumerlaeaceae bacterium]|nr:glycoside hydrolase family 13 protein [Candidatus Sumerlaeaceae bacterium]